MLKIRLFLIIIVTQTICAGIVTSTLKSAADAYRNVNEQFATVPTAPVPTVTVSNAEFIEDPHLEFAQQLMALPKVLRQLVNVKRLSTEIHDNTPGTTNLFFVKFFVAILHHYWNHNSGTEVERITETIHRAEEIYGIYATVLNGLINPIKKHDGTERPEYYQLNMSSLDSLTYAECVYETLQEFKIENLSAQRECIDDFCILLRKTIQTHAPSMIENQQITFSGEEMSKIIALYAGYYPEQHPALVYSELIRQAFHVLISFQKITKIEIEQAVQDDAKKITSNFGKNLDMIIQWATQQHKIPVFFNKKSNDGAAEKMPIRYFSRTADAHGIEKKVYQSSQVAFLVRLIQKKMLPCNNDAFEKDYSARHTLQSWRLLDQPPKEQARLFSLSNSKDCVQRDTLKVFDDVLSFCVGPVDATFFTESSDWYVFLNVMKYAIDHLSIVDDYLKNKLSKHMLILNLGSMFFIEKFNVLSNSQEQQWQSLLKETKDSATNLFNAKSWIKNLYELPSKCDKSEQNARAMLENEEQSALKNMYDHQAQCVRVKIENEESKLRLCMIEDLARLTLQDKEKLMRLGAECEFRVASAQTLFATYLQKLRQEQTRAFARYGFYENQNKQRTEFCNNQNVARSAVIKQEHSALTNIWAAYGIAINQLRKQAQEKYMQWAINSCQSDMDQQRTVIEQEEGLCRSSMQSLRQQDPVKIVYDAQQRGCVEQITIQQRALIESEEAGNRHILEQRLQKENEQKAREQLIKDESLSRRLFLMQKGHHQLLVATMLQHMIAVPELFNQVLIEHNQVRAAQQVALQTSRRAVGPVAVAVANNPPVRAAGDDVVPSQVIHNGPAMRYSHNPYDLLLGYTEEV